MINMLDGKTILVTGASSGIGRAVAKFFSIQGCCVVIAGQSESRLNETLSLLSGNGHFSVTGDLSDVEQLKAMMDSVFNKVGALDGIIHCAGIQKTLPLQALKESDFDDIFSVNVKSAQFLAKNFRRKGRYNKDGASLVFISSVAATCGEPAISTYSASKAALIGLTKSLASELSRNKIRVNCIAPGHVETEMAIEFSKQLTNEQLAYIKAKHPLGLGKPEDVAHAAAFLASDLSRWVTGTTLCVDGGYSAQ
ncbi:short-chain dehydrogenase [Photobacterium frigidiphilum]|uniref:Short-chain dehydrogenase n=1 Tax=Photobacterium frigidiphilum TaxID=264736 RepID=A0A2T3JPE3_9GAMM|nr:SDR family oxidoreductase [Photobacterium frigidiphilum]PSU50908.1 short-chain dehydrogenase [Photobacterium frigidiphilum]